MIRAGIGLAALALSIAVGASPVTAHDVKAHATKAAGTGSEADPLAGRFGGPFSLVDHNGRRVTDADFHGSFLLVYFGFTHCVDVCPVDLAVQQAAFADLGPEADSVQPVFITVDPDRDTPEVLKAYLADFDPRTLGLTGSEQEIAAVAKAYRVHRRKVALTHPEAEHLKEAAGEYIVDHGSLTYLMDRDGRFLTLVPHTTDAERLAEVLRSYLEASH